MARAHQSGAAAGCALPLLALLAAGCGPLNFVPSPYTPQHVELIYSAQEHITVVRWRVDATTPVAQTRFELLGSDGTYSPIDFSQSVFTGGVARAPTAAARAHSTSCAGITWSALAPDPSRRFMRSTVSFPAASPPWNQCPKRYRSSHFSARAMTWFT